jgi:hypothetical protein
MGIFLCACCVSSEALARSAYLLSRVEVLPLSHSTVPHRSAIAIRIRIPVRRGRPPGPPTRVCHSGRWALSCLLLPCHEDGEVARTGCQPSPRQERGVMNHGHRVQRSATASQHHGLAARCAYYLASVAGAPLPPNLHGDRAGALHALEAKRFLVFVSPPRRDNVHIAHSLAAGSGMTV